VTQALRPKVEDQNNGIYIVSYTLPEDFKFEELKLNILLQEQHIEGSPFSITVGPPLEFGAASSAVTLSNSNRTATNSVNHHFVLGNQSFTKGKHEWRIHIDKLEKNDWLFVGLTSTVPSTSNSFNLPSTYGIASMNQLYEGGKVTYPSFSLPYTPYFKEGDSIAVTLDCDTNSLKITELNRKVINHKINLPAGKTWYPHYNLRGRNDQITLV